MNRMRSRVIDPGFFANEELAKLDPIVRLAFIGLWCVADREGRTEDRPERLRALIFPYEANLGSEKASLGMDKVIQELEDAGFLSRYEVEGNRYIEINRFKHHQRPHVREAASTIPGNALPRHSLGQAKVSGFCFSLGSPRFTEKDVSSEPQAALEPVAVGIEAFPVVGKKAPKEGWLPTQALIDALAKAYPGTSIKAELDKARAWLHANPTRRKTPNGMPRFLNSWVERAQNGKVSSTQPGKPALSSDEMAYLHAGGPKAWGL